MTHASVEILDVLLEKKHHVGSGCEYYKISFSASYLHHSITEDHHVVNRIHLLTLLLKLSYLASS